MNEMLERVARAIDAELPMTVVLNPEELAAVARAAISAMRVPTKAMSEAVYRVSEKGLDTRLWAVAIDAALEPDRK